MICFKLDGFIIYIKVSFVTNQYCCLFHFSVRVFWKWLKCLPPVSSFVNPSVKPDYPGGGQAENQVTCKEGGWKEGGGGNAPCFLPADWVQNDVCWGEGDIDMIWHDLTWFVNLLLRLSALLASTLSWLAVTRKVRADSAWHISSNTKKCSWEGRGNAMAAATLPGLLLYIYTTS